MTTKAGILSLQEKKRIEELLKCSREKKRLHIVKKLAALRADIEQPYTTQIEKLQREQEDIRLQREEAVRQAGYGKIHERGCFDTHPDLDKFDAETNNLLIALWKASDTFLEE